MREAFLFTLGETRCAAWRDQVSAMEGVGSFHRLPFLKSSLNVLAVIGERTRTLADLSVCVGFAPQKERTRASALLMAENDPVQGFLVEGQPVSLQVREGSLIPLPAFLSIPALEGCLVIDDQAVPVLGITALYAMVKEGSREIVERGPAFSDQAPAQEPEGQDLRAFRAGGFLLTLPAAAIAGRALSDYRVVDLPFIPKDIDGLAVLRDRILPIVDARRRLSPAALGAKGVTFDATTGGRSVALLVDEDSGAWAGGDTRIRGLPPVTQSPWLRFAATRKGEVAGLIDLGAFLSRRPDGPGEKDLAARHKPDSSFPSRFRREAVRVVEFDINGRRHAIPESEMKDVVPVTPVHPVPLSPGIVAGVSDYDGALLPVLDFTRLYGESPEMRRAGKMMVIVNGSFRALLLVERVFDARPVGLDEQRDVPVTLLSPVVYGCYTAGESVRLIFNIEALAVHLEEPSVTHFMKSLAPLPSLGTAEIRASQSPPEITRVFAPAQPQPATAPAPVAPAEAVLEAPSPPPPPIAEEPGSAASRTPVQAESVEPQAPPEEERRPAAETPTLDEEEELEPAVSAANVPPMEEAARRGPAGRAEPPRKGKLPKFAVGAAVVVLLVVGFFLVRGFVRTPAPAGGPAPTPAAVVSTPAPANTPASTPPPASTPAPAPTVTDYVVREGDTLWDIANRLTGEPRNYRSIARQNGIQNSDLIFPGQQLQIPR